MSVKVTVISVSQLEAMLDEMEKEFQADVDRAWPRANERRREKGLEPLSREQAEAVLKTVCGGDKVANVVGVEVGEDGSLTI
jgi:hypothetical protein